MHASMHKHTHTVCTHKYAYTRARTRVHMPTQRHAYVTDMHADTVTPTHHTHFSDLHVIDGDTYVIPSVWRSVPQALDYRPV